MLASLVAVFAWAGVGEVVGDLIGTTIPEGSLFGATLAFGLGMALFTMVMGNAFAAFPVMLAAVGMPLLIEQYGGDHAVVAAIGMLAGFCGVLMKIGRAHVCTPVTNEQLVCRLLHEQTTNHT